MSSCGGRSRDNFRLIIPYRAHHRTIDQTLRMETSYQNCLIQYRQNQLAASLCLLVNKSTESWSISVEPENNATTILY